MTSPSLVSAMERQMAAAARYVFLTKDFAALGDPSSIQRALRALMAKRKLVRLGQGVYAQARPSSLSSRAVLTAPAGFQAVAQEALTRLGVAWQPSGAQTAFAAGRSTQLPVNPVVKVKGRFSRKLAYGPHELVVERCAELAGRAPREEG